MDTVTLKLPRQHVQWLLNVLASTPLRYGEVHPVVSAIAQQMSVPQPVEDPPSEEDDAA